MQAPRRSDVITFDSPDEGDVTLVKCVIATEGQVVDIRDGGVRMDNEELWEPYANGLQTLPPDPSGATAGSHWEPMGMDELVARLKADVDGASRVGL